MNAYLIQRIQVHSNQNKILFQLAEMVKDRLVYRFDDERVCIFATGGHYENL